MSGSYNGVMNARHARFVQEYLVDGNGTAAAVRAGYARAGAHVTASRLLRNPKVAEAVAKGQQRTGERLRLDRVRVLEEIKGAIDMAREQGNAMAQISGWREIAKICGYYAPERKHVELSGAAREKMTRLEAMSDDEL